VAITTRQLIDSAYKFVVNSEELDTLSPKQESQGLILLNQLLDFKTAEISQIPYYQPYNFTAVVGQEEYFIPLLVYPSTITFTLGTVRYEIDIIQRKQYKGWGRANNITTLPSQAYFQRTLNGTNLFLYPLPNLAYPFEIEGKFGFSSVTIDEELTAFEGFYLRYLKYALAEDIADEYQISLTPSQERKLRHMERMIRDVSPPDLSLDIMQVLGNGPFSLNYGDVNIGKGFRP